MSLAEDRKSKLIQYGESASDDDIEAHDRLWGKPDSSTILVEYSKQKESGEQQQASARILSLDWNGTAKQPVPILVRDVYTKIQEHVWKELQSLRGSRQSTGTCILGSPGIGELHTVIFVCSDSLAESSLISS